MCPIADLAPVRPAAQYVGDTAFGFTVRVFGTFIGAVAGLLIWTIAAGTGIANPYALAAVCAVAFPVLMFVRSYYQPPVAAILPIVTTMLILGYSYQDSHQPALVCSTALRMPFHNCEHFTDHETVCRVLSGGVGRWPGAGKISAARIES